MKPKSFASPSRFFTCYGRSSFCSLTPPSRHLFKKNNTFASPWTCYLGSKASFTSTAAMSGEWERDVNWKLRKLHDPTWGYTIFRTVYTPASDTQFPLCLRKLDSWIKHEIYDEFNRPFGRPRVATDPMWRIESNDEMYSRYKNEVVEDRERLDGADVVGVRREFKARLKERGVNVKTGYAYTPYRACVMVDEEVLQNIMSAPDEPTPEYGSQKGWVKLVEFAGNDEGDEDDYEKGEGEAVVDGVLYTWEGWLKVDMRHLYHAWFSINSDGEVAYLWQEAMEENNGVYRE